MDDPAARRLAGIADGLAQFSGSLPNVCALADLKLERLLNTIDAWAGAAGERFAPTTVRSAPLGLDLRSGQISTIVWATGHDTTTSLIGNGTVALLAHPGQRDALAALHGRFPAMRLAVPRPALRWSHGDGLVLRGLSDLPVILHP